MIKDSIIKTRSYKGDLKAQSRDEIEQESTMTFVGFESSESLWAKGVVCVSHTWVSYDLPENIMWINEKNES